jgi:Leucine Rich Repeat
MVIFPLDPCEDASLNPLWRHAVCGLDTAAERVEDVVWLTLRGGHMGDIGPITLPNDLRKFSRLQVLELEYYSAVHLTEVLSELPELHALILLGNEFAPGGMTIGPHLDQVEGLRALYLDGFFPLSLTDEISRCDGLTTLWIDECGFDGEDVILSLTGLEELSIDFDLGDGFSRLTQLKRLRLTPKGDLPESIRDLGLRTLAIQSSGPLVLPEWIGQMESLQELDLCNCDIRELPDGLSSLSRIEVKGTPLLEQSEQLRARFPEVEIIT